MASKGRGFRAETIEGFEVLVGKGDAENDRLTFGVAEPHDLWLHVAGPAGSHVVIRNPDRLDELTRAVIERAAELAAWHSKARGARGKVEVHVCRLADVGKPRGFAAGQVLLKTWKAVKVYPRAAARRARLSYCTCEAAELLRHVAVERALRGPARAAAVGGHRHGVRGAEGRRAVLSTRPSARGSWAGRPDEGRSARCRARRRPRSPACTGAPCSASSPPRRRRWRAMRPGSPTRMSTSRR